jgi:hypothetical protein
VKSATTARFRGQYAAAPQAVRAKIQAAHALWLEDPGHHSLRFKKVHTSQPIYSASVDLDWRALGLLDGETVVWFWVSVPTASTNACSEGCRRASESMSDPDTSSSRSRTKSMAKAERNIGQEILDRIREIKRGEHGRVRTAPFVQSIQEGTALSRSQGRAMRVMGTRLKSVTALEPA